MDEAVLQGKLDQVRAVVEGQDLVYKAQVRKGATEAELLALEAFIGNALPLSLRTFLRLRNGMFLSAWALTTDHPPRFGYMKYALSVGGTIEMRRGTEDIRGYLEGIDIEAIGAEAGIGDLREQLQRCIEVATLNDHTQRVCFSLDQPRENAEYALFEAEVGPCMTWFVPVARDFSRVAVSDSFNTFLDRALSFMITKGTGFRYW